MKLNVSQYSQLRKYDRYLRTAHYANYITGMSLNIAQQLKDIYEKVTKKEFTRNLSCGKCKLDLCKRLAVLYFNYIETNVENKPSDNEK